MEASLACLTCCSCERFRSWICTWQFQKQHATLGDPSNSAESDISDGFVFEAEVMNDEMHSWIMLTLSHPTLWFLRKLSLLLVSWSFRPGPCHRPKTKQEPHGTIPSQPSQHLHLICVACFGWSILAENQIQEDQTCEECITILGQTPFHHGRMPWLKGY